VAKSATSLFVDQLPELWQPRAAVTAGVLLVGVLYYLGARLGFVLAATPVPISMVWVPNALLLAAFLLTPKRLWPAIIVVVLPAHLLAELQSGVAFPMALAWYGSNCAEALFGAVLIHLVLQRSPRFDSLRDVSVFLLFGALLSPLLSSLLDAAHVRLIGGSHYVQVGYWDLVRLRTFANVLSALVLVPFIIAGVAGARGAARAAAGRYVEAAVLFLGLSAVSAAAFLWGSSDGHNTPALFYAPLPFLLWAAVRFGSMGISTANLLLAGTALWGAVNGLGPFLEGTPEENARDVQLFLIAVAVPLLMLAALLEERRNMEREAREQSKQLTHLSRIAMLGGLSGALAHELNQPLTAILSNAQAAQHLLAGGKLDLEELGEILSDIVSADRRARDVISKLRALFQKGDTQLQSLDANGLVQEVLELSRSDFITREIAVVTELQPALPPIHCDRVQLQQVLLNLALNACEAMSVSSEKRVLTIRTCSLEGHSVQISVMDRGPGLSREARDRLFQPFYTTKSHGLGLGLYISRSIISAHGGRLWAAPVPGHGASFHVALPSALEHSS
jgi:signal transduction histidine kinase